MRLSEGSYSNLNVNDNVVIRGKPLLDKGVINSAFLDSSNNNDDVASLINAECLKLCESHRKMHTETVNKLETELKKVTQMNMDLKKELTVLKNLFNETKNEVSELKKNSAFR